MPAQKWLETEDSPFVVDLLAGRLITLNLFPYCFSEFKQPISEYLLLGSLPYDTLIGFTISGRGELRLQLSESSSRYGELYENK